MAGRAFSARPAPRTPRTGHDGLVLWFGADRADEGFRAPCGENMAIRPALPRSADEKRTHAATTQVLLCSQCGKQDLNLHDLLRSLGPQPAIAHFAYLAAALDLRWKLLVLYGIGQNHICFELYARWA